ncbi:MAG: ATP-binding cassette domain-containing protein [Candidatus Micrarchaeota archaeon]|nr:ATP-binding cassette domain-containing protein [Candidatus Micrarchaeota archaeon]
MPDSIITISNVKKRFKTYKAGEHKKGFLGRLMRKYYYNQALDGVSFGIKKGEITALLGKNGSGKSTLIKIMTGVLHPDSGEVLVDGMSPWGDRTRLAKEIGVVFSQHNNLYFDLPPSDTFDYMKSLYSVPEHEYRQRLRYLLKLLDFEDKYKTQTRLLSFGERMKGNFISALLHNPKIVFLDEATVGIDLPSRFALRKAVQQMRKDFGTTFVIATHIVDDIEALAERIIFVDKSKVIFDGPRGEFDSIIGNKKHIELQFSDGVDPKIKGFGKVLEQGEGYIKLEIDSDKVKDKSLSRLLFSKGVIDYSVYEPDLSYILGKFYATLDKRKK